jgi:hypothetical protein
MGELPVLTGMKEAMLPVPLAASPIEVLSFVQEYEVPVPSKSTAAIDSPTQTSWSAGLLTVGVGLIAMNPVVEIVPHPPVSVTV